MERALTFIGGMLSFAVGFMLTDITGLTGIRLPRDGWHCTDQGPRTWPDDVPDWKRGEQTCKQWSKK